MTVFRSGFAALVGRPNVGKSTLLNRLVGEKVAIVSPKPQTTRNRIVGVVTRPEGQLALLDTPGVHVAQNPLGRYMVKVALEAVDEVELVMLVVEAPETENHVRIDDHTQTLLDRLGHSKKNTFLVINKVDAVPKQWLLPQIELYRNRYPFAEIHPLSAKTGNGVEAFLQRAYLQLPEGEPLFDKEILTDQMEKTLVGEYIREPLLRHCRQEVPYASAVRVEEFDESERHNGERSKNNRKGLIRIHASILVERDSQKAIVIGKQGQMLKKIGTDARMSIERFLGCRVFLALHVRVEPSWSERPDSLRQLGYL